MLKATTLVHKGAMKIGVHAIQSFARHFSHTHTLTIHTDQSIEENDHIVLLQAAEGMEAKLVTAKDRKLKTDSLLDGYPLTKKFLKNAAIYTKLELPIFEGKEFFYFDSDVVWLRHVTNLEPETAPNAFSTESWTWYNGIANDKLWIKAKTPRRVNSGFYYLGEEFPFQKMEEMLELKMFDLTIPNATDQEIFAYLYNNMAYYHPEDLKRSRVMTNYNLAEETCAALHFPGKMWMQHFEQVEKLGESTHKTSTHVRYQPAVPITVAELFRMRAQVRLSNSSIFAEPLNLFRKLRRAAK